MFMACTNETVNKIVKILDGKKGRDIDVINVSELTTMTDYFVIVTGGSDTQVKALCDNVEEELEKEGHQPPWARRATEQLSGFCLPTMRLLFTSSLRKPGSFTVLSGCGKTVSALIFRIYWCSFSFIGRIEAV